jgi:hypothetical protein
MTQSYSKELLPLAKAILRSLPGQTSNAVLSALDGCHDDMLQIKVDPHKFTDTEAFAVDYQAVSLLSKWDGWSFDLDPAEEALKVFFAGEERNKQINLNGYDRNWSSRFREPRALGTRYEAIISIAKRKMLALLGDFSWDLIYPLLGFSGGASTRLPRRSGDPAFKFTGKPEVTQKARLLAICDIWSCPLWREYMLEHHGSDPELWVTVVGGSRLDLVDKNAKTKRVINIEPDMNMRFQKGIGRYFRKCLRRVGINLNDQTRNQMLAYLGSITGEIATLDLENASGSICQRIVWDLFSRDWAEAMDLVRCSGCYIDGPKGTKIWHEFSMWSSMGNGYTFEMESLIFWAICSAVAEAHGEVDRRLSVYGDDIIVPTSLAEPVISVLGYCGFRTNEKKTFYYGAFRESCGKHYFNGVDVTPIYWKAMEGTTLDGCLIANSYAEWADKHQGVASNKVFNYLTQKASKLHGPKPDMIPDGFGLKAGIITHWDNARPWTTSNLSSRPLAYVFDVLRFIPEDVETPELGRYMAVLESPVDSVEPNPYERKLARKGKMRSVRMRDPAWVDPERSGFLYLTPETHRMLCR